MLHELRIHNLALIDRLDLTWPERGGGLTVLTGETGAGKSIILQALTLLAGGRGNAAWVRGESGRADIEARFSSPPEHEALRALLDEHGLSAEEGDVLLRRVLHQDGRSRLFVNDRSVTAKLAAELGGHLVNIAGQHDQQLLLRERHHLDFLDSYGELGEQRAAYAVEYAAWRRAETTLRDLRQREADKEREREFLRRQLEEIEKIAPEPGEDEQLARERDRLKSAEALVQAMTAVERELNDAGNLLVAVKKKLEQAAGLDGELTPLAERASAAGFELEDMAAAAGHYLAALPTDGSRLENIAARLADLKQLMRKHGPTLAEVLAFAEKAAAELELLDNMEEAIRRAEKEADALAHRAEEAAAALSRARATAAQNLAVRMEEELASLNFNQARFAVDLRETPLGPQGREEAVFLFSANPGEPLKELARIVSGGELSRMLLAMKCLLARRDAVDTVVFDEVDAGIGGQTAEAVAEKINELAGHHQVLCITHLPQIAARADLHFKVEKRVAEGRTTTGITLLDDDARLAELARMLDGEQAGEQTRAYVRELLSRKRGAGGRKRETRHESTGQNGPEGAELR